MAYERKTVDILVSDELKSILSEIEHDSLVAQILLKKRHPKESLVDDPINYISISTSDNTKISYLTSDRMSKMEESEYWSSSRRFQAKPGSFVSKIFKDIPAKEVEKFSNLYKTLTKRIKFNFEVVSGDDIKRYYLYDSYQSGGGTLGGSCMKHESSQKLLNIYSENPEKVSMLVMLDERGYLMGRALLWNFESHKIMDRIYTICDEDYAFLFKKWATDNGYLFKSEQNWYNTLFFESIGGKKQQLKLKLSLKNSEQDYYPYMDTFKFIDDDCNLYNYHPEVRFKILCTTDGSKNNQDYLRFDGVDNVYRYSHETVYLDYLDIYTRSSNCNYSESNDCYILCKDAVWMEEARDYVFNDEYSEKNDKERIDNRIKRYNNNDDSESRRKRMMDIINEVTNLDISDYFTYRRNRFTAPEQTEQQDEMLEESGL
jgi:hypothetical protein